MSRPNENTGDESRRYLKLIDPIDPKYYRGLKAGTGPVCIACRRSPGGPGTGECVCLECCERIRSLRGMFCAKCKGSLTESVKPTNEPK